MKIYIIRHGESEANKEKILQGQYNSKLTEEGIRLARVTGKALGELGIKFDAAFSSDLDRAYDTAVCVLEESGNRSVNIIKDKRIIEVDVGEYEAKSLDPAAGEIPPEQMYAFKIRPLEMGSFPDGESLNDCIKRTWEFLMWLKDQPYESVLVATHGCAVRCMLNALYEDPDDFWQGRAPFNCAVNIIETTDNEPYLRLVERDRIYYNPEDAVDLFRI